MSRDYEKVFCNHCGWLKTIPYPSLQSYPAVAPSDHDLKAMSYAKTQELIYHLNNACPWMWAERRKMLYSTKPAITRFTL